MEPRSRNIPASDQRSPKVGGFTLIELMVVVSIIALLLAILLPSLGRAREEARKVVCLSNLHQLANALEAYVITWNGYPVGALDNGRGQSGLCSWSWGGKTASIDPWRSYANGLFYLKASERPLNPMLGRSPATEPETIDDDAQRAEMKIYRCPSDDATWQALWHSGGHTRRPAYEDVGTSYQLNYHWHEQARRRREPFARQVDWGARLLMRRRLRGASRFLLLLEDSLDRSIASRIETLGLHRRWATHNVLMLDGHAQVLTVKLNELDRFPFPYGSEWSAYDDEAFRASPAASVAESN